MALYAVAGLVPLCHPGVQLLGQPAWLAAYAVLGLALRFGGTTRTEDRAHRARQAACRALP